MPKPPRPERHRRVRSGIRPLAFMALCAASASACRFGYELVDGNVGGSPNLGGASSAGDTSAPPGGNPEAGANAGHGGDDAVSVAGSGSGAASGLAGTTGLGGTNDSGGATTNAGTASVAGGGGASGNAGTSGSGGAGSAGDLVVTTNVDENDAGASVGTPGGTGLSLREAVTIANATAGAQAITFESGIVVAQVAPLPTITDSVRILGGVINCKGIGNNANCLNLAASNALLDGLEIYASGGRSIYWTGGTNSQITNCNFHDNKAPLETSAGAGSGNVIGPNNTFENSLGHAIAVYSDDTNIVDNVILDSVNNGIFLSGTANATLIQGNIVARAGTAIGMAAGTTNVRIWHNTLAYNSVSGVVVGQATGMDVRNNIIAFNGQYALVGADVKFTQLDYNLLFANAAGNCNPCTVGANSVLADPQFVNGAAADYRLNAGSPAINAGIDLGLDRNGSAANDFNGAAPDIGSWESP